MNHAHLVMDTLQKDDAAAMLSPDSGIRASWKRSAADHGLVPDRIGHPEILTHAELLVRRELIEDLYVLSNPEVDRLYERLADHAPVVMLTDAQGAVIQYRCPASVMDECSRFRLLPGSIWTEETQGTTGISLCLKEQRPVSVLMSEHFATKLATISCTVAPIFGENGQLAGTLNVSSLRPTDHAFHSILRELAASSARRIENLCFDRRHARHYVLRLSRHDDFCDGAAEARLAIDDSGRIIDATPLTHWLLAASGVDTDRLVGQRLGALEGVENVDHLLSSFAGTLGSAMKPVHVKAIRPGPGAHASASVHAPMRPRSVPRALAGGPGSPAHHAGPARAPTLAEMVGHDDAMVKALRVAQRLHGRGLPLLLQGESGSGKTQLARALHAQGPHRKGRFVVINCAAIPHELIESELFGYRAGAFTGAAKQGSPGRLAGAHGGTLFLDEIGDMPLPLQGRLLQVLSDGEFVPVGATEPVRIRFALISATLHDLQALVREGRFREDLYYRISGGTLCLPALRERSDRMALIERAFESAATEAGLGSCTLSPQTRGVLENHGWPGNVRELLHVARFATAVTESPTVELHSLPPPLGRAEGEFPQGASGARVDSRADSDPAALAAALERHGWNVSATAKQLGVSRATLHRRLHEFALSRPGKSGSA
ncbi:sigma-54-dependent Fis family transcriptional regulator [Alcaligenaceae bacterium]|nr:sigma-54-dependent Fis family transcriptional regulator [Alcaligenaceae bacterium]